MDRGYRPLRITLDATPLLLRSAGVKSVLYHWLEALRAEAGEERIETFPPLGALGALDHERSVAGRMATWRGIALALATSRLGLPCPDWFAGRPDIFHATNQVRRGPREARLTATLHDLTCWRMPELHTAANVKADSEYAERILKRADGLIAVSENTRRDAVEILGIAPERITVIPNGVAEGFFLATKADAAAARVRLGLAKPYVLVLGTIEPRKNLGRLLDAWSGVRTDLRQAHELVIAGPAGWGSDDVASRIDAGTEGVRRLGYVAEADLPGLTKGATVVAYPSLYEGFGLPAAQAMAAGVAVLASNTSSLPEVTGDGGMLVDPQSTGEIARGLERMLDDAGLRERLGAAGRARAESRYRWPHIARQSLGFFRKVAG
jgi:alpha-1,3-rhamnosyl/mannosyltransferase